MMELKAKSHKLETRKGFTIIELLAVMAITVLLGSILLANTRGPSRKFDLRRGVQTLSADFRKAQALAISAQLVQCGSSTKVPNYGLRIQSNTGTNLSYSIFADCDQDNQFNLGGDDFVVETTNLVNLFVSSTNPSSGGASYLDIVYIPPIPDVAIDGSTPSYPSISTFSINLCHSGDSSLCSEVRGNSRGNVEIVE